MFKKRLAFLLLTVWASFGGQFSFANQDPTKPLFASESVTSSQAASHDGDLVLQSIINASDKQNVKAIISGNIVAQGDVLDSYEIIEITNTTVTLQSSEGAKKLVLFAKSIVNSK